MAAKPGFSARETKHTQLSLIYLAALVFFLLLILGCALRGKLALIPALNACFLSLLYVAIAVLYEQLRQQFTVLTRRLDLLEDRLQATTSADAVQNIFDREKRQQRRREDHRNDPRQDEE